MFDMDSLYNLLRKYSTPSMLEEIDKNSVDDLVSVGLMTFGLAGIGDSSGIYETAKLTDMGKEVYRRERRLRNPVTRFIDEFFHGM